MRIAPGVVVVGWAAGNFVLALLLLVFTRTPLVVLLHVLSSFVVAGFGLVVLAAIRGGRAEVQRREPRRATSAAFAAMTLGVGLLGLVYGWQWSVLAAYPLGTALWMLRGERLPASADPWPVAAEDLEPAGPPRLVHQGEAVGTSVAVPVPHDAHGPAPARPPRSLGVVKTGGALVAAFVVDRILRRRR